MSPSFTAAAPGAMLDGVPVSPYIFLNPDGSQRRFDLNVVVEAPTGVVYAYQCAGHFHEIREVEGFLIPVGGSGPSADPPVATAPVVPD